MEGGLVLEIKTQAERELHDHTDGLTAEEAAVLASLRTRLDGERLSAGARTRG